MRSMMSAEYLAATTYADMGLHVVPCGPDKVAWVKWKEPPTPEKVREWWTARPNALIGMVCGPSGIVAIDIDVKDGRDGWGTIDALMREHGELPGTRTSETPTGGAHLLYRAPDGFELGPSAGQIGEGVDIRAGWSYVILPPSKAAHGEYTWLVDQRTAVLPEAWAMALQKPKREPAPPPSFVTKKDAGRARNYSVAALQDEARALAAMRSGRNDELVRAASRLGGLVHLGGISEDDIRTALMWACSTWPDCDPRKDRDTMERGLRFGVDHPREWRDSEAA